MVHHGGKEKVELSEMITLAITTYGLVAIALVLSEQLARLLYYAIWRLRK
jgi:hypothetical protein